MRARTLVALSTAAVVLLAGVSTLAFAAARGGFDFGSADLQSDRGSCPVPNLAGTVLNVAP